MTISLSVSSINKKAPYPVWSENGYTFLFKTNAGVVYEVGFVEDHMISDEGDVLQLFICVTAGALSYRDPAIQSTVIAILEEFFRIDDVTLVYICDTQDGRQASRQRLFSIWFHTYPDREEYYHDYRELRVDGTGYYMALLSKADNPLLPSRREAFELLHKQLSGK